MSERRARRLAIASLALFAAVHGFVLLTHATRSVGGSDSSGYFNSARALSRGRIVEPVEALGRLGFAQDDIHLVIPLGYVPGPRPATMASFYPPGLPLHILGAAAVAGWNEAPFWVPPLGGVATVVLTYLVGRELSIPRSWCLAAAAAIACLPVLNFEAVQLMSDTAAAAWALAAVYFALLARRRSGWALAAGLAFGVEVLVRPASAVLLPAVAIALPWRFRAWIPFASGGAPCAVFFGIYNRIGYGGSLKTGYGAGGAFADFAVANFRVCSGALTYWLSHQTTPILLAAAALGIAMSRRRLRDRLLLLAWFGAFFLIYCFYAPSKDAWWYTRYLLPAVPAIFLGASLFAEALVDRAERIESRRGGGLPLRRMAAVLGALLFAGVCLRGLQLGRRYRVLDVGRGEIVYPETIRWAAARVPADAVVVTMQLSGAMRAYGWGIPFLRWDWIDAARFPELRRSIEGRGLRIYALVFPFELRDAASRLPGKWTYLGSNREVGLFRLD